MTKPTENELFELYDKVAYMPNDGQDDPLTPFGNFCAGYEAAQQQSAGEIAELKDDIENLHTVMMAAAVEITEHWDAHCDEEGYGPTNLVRRLENGFPEQYGYDAKTLVNIDNQIAELKADNERLREAIKELQKFDVDVVFKKICNEALAKTAPQCLVEHDNEIIERCAKVCESLKEQDYCVDVRHGAEAIRVLKGDPNANTTTN